MKKILSILFFLISFAVLPQGQKQEVEKRIDKVEMPEKAVSIYERKIPEKIGRERFYYETDGEKESYEAKFKYNNRHFSVEFEKDGSLSDIEIELKKSELPEKPLSRIKFHLKNQHERHKIEKIQAQYLPKRNPAQIFQDALQFSQNSPDNFELIVAVKNDGKRERYELLFDNHGTFIEKREIAHKSFEYLLFH